MAMGLEFLFAPITILFFVGAVFCLVLLQRFLFHSAFKVWGMKRVITGYGIVLIVSLMLGVVSGGGALKASVANGMLACYVSMIFVTLGLLPISLILVRRGHTSIVGVIGAGIVLSILIGVGMAWTVGLDKLFERGMGGASMQGSTFAFLVAVSVAFAVGLKAR